MITLFGEDKERECLVGKRFKLFIKNNIFLKKIRNCILCVCLVICCLGLEKGFVYFRIFKIIFENVLKYCCLLVVKIFKFCRFFLG